jgi:uncharacterized membrane protein YcfT
VRKVVGVTAPFRLPFFFLVSDVFNIIIIFQF